MGTELPERFAVGKAYRVAVHGDLAAVGNDSSLALWNLRTGKKLRALRALPHQGQPAFSPDGSLLAVKNPHGDLAVVAVDTGARVAIAKRKQRDEGPDPEFLDDELVVDGTWSGALAVRDARTLDVVAETATGGQIGTLAVDGTTIAACVRARGADDATVMRWRWQRRKLAPAGPAVAIAGGWKLAFAPRLRAIAFVGATGMLEVHQLGAAATKPLARLALAKTGQPRAADQLGSPFRISFSPDGKLVAAGDGQLLALYDAASLEPKLVQPWPGASGAVFGEGVLVVESWTRGAVLATGG